MPFQVRDCDPRGREVTQKLQAFRWISQGPCWPEQGRSYLKWKRRRRASASPAPFLIFGNSARWRSGGHVLRTAALRLGLRAPATEHRSDRFHYWVAGFILGDDRDSTLPYVLR